MNPHDHDSDKALRARLHYLLDLDISAKLPPVQRLLLAVLRQSVVDYFGDDPLQQLDAALYFAHSPLYRATLHQFGLPETLLPDGVELSGFRRQEKMEIAHEFVPLQLETLVRRLSGPQLKVILTMGLLPLPTTTRRIGLEQLATHGLVEVDDQGARALWSVGDEMQQLLAEVWGRSDTLSES